MKLAILGGGESGIGSAVLAHSLNYHVFLSDGGNLKPEYKEKLIALNIPFEEGGHSEDLILGVDLVVKSPGIPDDAPLIAKLLKNNVAVISEIEFGYRHTKSKIIAITGSNGKTTTTSLTYHILKEAGLNVALGGNIGKSFAALVAEGVYDYFVLEISSFQLDGIINFNTEIAILLNITPDHLDRYQYNFENYVRSKFRIALNQNPEGLFIYSADDHAISSHIDDFKIKARKSAVKHPLVENGVFSVGDFKCPVNDISIKGPHNEINAACAVLAALELGIDDVKIKSALKSFKNFPHRLEFVRAIDGVTFINDSKATNVDASYYGLSSMDQPTIWIVGGTDKGNDYSPLLDLVREKVKAIVCLGIDNEKIIKFFEGHVDLIVETQSAANAVKTAFSIATSGDTVLLSPACASFDLFKNYENRGELFKEAVNELSNKIEN
ncbi:MAG: UDP-N-acetylmuramoyl-L-alanine--D-glutamate ligase [Saprospiraceae bacterium]|nr:UDP-N-acetylmuramoyl-L-alanine--D-glutamate ligase [Saprospiraceae bacterium]